MGEWDTYCAICHGSTGTYDIGSSKPEALKRRREMARKYREAEEAGEDYKLGIEDDDEAPSYSDTDSFPDEGGRYNPDLVSQESSSWIEETFCVGLVEISDGLDQGWIAKGNTWGHNGQYIITEEIDPNQPDDNFPLCYTASYDQEDYVFAVHESCLALLARLLTGSLDINLLDKTSLYNTLDYHAIDGLHFSTDPNYEHWQSWESRPGDEFVMADPVSIPGLSEFVRAEFVSKLPDTILDSTLLNPSKKNNSSDLFSKMPPELIYHTLRDIPGKELVALTVASPTVFCATDQYPSFWEKRIASDMPWFWELGDLTESYQASDRVLDYKRLYFWLQKTTATLRFNEGPFLGLVNRRRIWECELLLLRKTYLKK